MAERLKCFGTWTEGTYSNGACADLCADAVECRQVWCQWTQDCRRTVVGKLTGRIHVAVAADEENVLKMQENGCPNDKIADLTRRDIAWVINVSRPKGVNTPPLKLAESDHFYDRCRCGHWLGEHMGSSLRCTATRAGALIGRCTCESFVLYAGPGLPQPPSSTQTEAISKAQQWSARMIAVKKNARWGKR